MSEHDFNVFTEAEMDNLIALCERVAKKRTADLHTLRECSAPDCELGVRNQYSVLGMCVTCAEGEIERLRGIETRIRAACGADYPGGWRVRWAAIVDTVRDVLEAKP